MGVWQGVGMDSIKFHPGLLCPNLLLPAGRPAGKPPLKRLYGLMAFSGVALPQGRQPATVFYPLGHPTPYAYAESWYQPSPVPVTLI
jgi:hypothetical protein